MSETYETPRGGRKPSKLPRFVKEQAAGVSSMLKSMSEHEAGTEPSPRSSQGSISSRIPLLQSMSSPNRKPTPKSSESAVLKLNVLSLGSLKDEMSQRKIAGTDKHHVMQLVKEIPGIWAGVVTTMATAYNEMMQLAIDNKLDHQPEKLSANTASIKNKIEAAKTATTSKFTLIARYLQEAVGKSTESEKLLANIKTLNQKIKTLGCNLKKTEAALELEKEQAASTKEALECRLKETAEALEKALAELATSEKPAFLEVVVPVDAPETAEAQVKKNSEKANSGKQIQLLKSTVRKLETNVEQLSKQNEYLRKMLASAKRRSSKEESETLENNVGHTLQQILNEKQQNLEKLSYVIQKIKEHHNTSRDQQKQLDTRVQLLQSQM